MLPWPANATADIYRSGNAPPANPDVNQVTLHLRPQFARDAYEHGVTEASNLRFTHVAYFELATDIRDSVSQFTQGSSQDTVWIPDKNGVPYKMVFVERVLRNHPMSCKRVYLHRKLPTWPLNANQCQGINQNGAGQYAPTASFTFSPSSPLVGDTVSFTDTSAGYPTSWAWNFGDSNTSTSQNPTHAYGSANTYTVQLTATNAYGSNSVSHTVTVSSGVSTSCCANNLPTTLHGTFSGGTGSCTCLNNVTITLTWNGTSWQGNVSACSHTVNLGLTCVAGTWSLTSGGCSLSLSNPTSSQCSPFQLVFSNANIADCCLGTITLTITT
jgi:PKD repeat protein